MRRDESRRSFFDPRATTLATALALMLCVSASVAAQSRLDLGGGRLPQGQELHYLRNLSLVDSATRVDVILQPGSHRAQVAARKHAASTAHPWQQRFQNVEQPFALPLPAELDVRLLRPEARAVFLTDRPFALDDGVAWSGRGATFIVQGGAAARWRGVRFQLAPVAFIAQNADFALAPNGFSDARRYRDARYRNNIDLPQRFGASSYGRVDLGDSFVEAEFGALAIGLSNARQHWGPAREYPLVLGTGSGGFPHMYFGSAAPLNIYVGQLQIRWMAAKLEQTSYSPVTSGERSRFLSAVVMSLRPRLVPSLEFGVSRLINGSWPAGGYGLSELLLPFEGIVNDNVSSINRNDYNGFAAVFLRFAPPGSGLEVYGELSREDFAGDVRQLYLEPDDLVQYTLGIARARGDANALKVLRAELVNGEVSHFEREGRGLHRPISPYRHGGTRQGLTNRGQVLGSTAAFGGAGATVAWESITPAGRRSIAVDRTLLRDWLPAQGIIGGVPEGEVTYRVRFEQLRFRGDAEWAVTLAPHYTLNRNLARGDDALGLELQLRWQGW